MYYTMPAENADAWILPLTSFHFTLVNNIMRDPFEQAVGTVRKSAGAMIGSLAAPQTAMIYDWNMLPIGQQLWYEHLLSFKEFPPLQLAANYNLGEIQRIIEAAHSRHPSE
jgi:arylsulfatase